MKELRDIKLDLLMGNQNPIVDLFNKITKDIKIINCHVYNNEGLEFIYHKDGQWIFYQDCKNEKFWTNYYKYWSLFESNLRLEYKEIQAITKYLVEEALKREVSTPFTSGTPLVSTPDSIITKYGNKVIIPKMLPKIEEALKREVSTPHEIRSRDKKAVEDALKREISLFLQFLK
jgi:hypothetical protein